MRKFLIILIFVIALLFRVWRISTVPPSLSIDEVTYGYAGYSILTTGHDEFGNFLPLAFKGIGDYKAPVNAYLNALSIFLFGLNEFAERIPVAFFGSLTCLAVIFLLKEFGLKWKGALFGGFWLSISGWHIFYSRTGYDAINALFFLILGIFLFLKGIRLQRKNFLNLSFVLFSLSVWAYHAERIFVPVLFLFLILYFRKNVTKIYRKRKDFILPIIIFSFFAIPFLYLLFFSKGISARAMNLWIGNAPHRGNIIEAFVGQYLNYFDLKFIFWDGLNLVPKGFQGVGLLNLIDIPLVIAGIYGLVKLKVIKFRNLIFFLMFLYPLPGAFTRGDPSSSRGLVGVPFFVFIVAYGFQLLAERFGKKGYFIYFVGAIISVFYFINIFNYLFPKYNADVWEYGYKEVARYVCENNNKYNKVIVTDKYGIDLPSTKTVPNYYFLFFCKGIPNNLEIRQPQWRLDSKNKNYLLVGSRWDFPEGFPESRIMKKVYFPNSEKAAFYFVETDK